MHGALLCNDELTMLMRFNRNFSGFAEGPLNFFPTYKFDPQSDHYDSSQKRRVPSWTDRILYKSDTTTQVLSYCSAPGIRTSDHRPVYATFKSRISFDNDKRYEMESVQETIGATKNEACCISWEYMSLRSNWIIATWVRRESSRNHRMIKNDHLVLFLLYENDNFDVLRSERCLCTSRYWIH